MICVRKSSTYPFSPLFMTEGSVKISPTPTHKITHTQISIMWTGLNELIVVDSDKLSLLMF